MKLLKQASPGCYVSEDGRWLVVHRRTVANCPKKIHPIGPGIKCGGNQPHYVEWWERIDLSQVSTTAHQTLNEIKKELD